LILLARVPSTLLQTALYRFYAIPHNITVIASDENDFFVTQVVDKDSGDGVWVIKIDARFKVRIGYRRM
jgi:hypothetical protein